MENLYLLNFETPDFLGHPNNTRRHTKHTHLTGQWPQYKGIKSFAQIWPSRRLKAQHCGASENNLIVLGRLCFFPPLSELIELLQQDSPTIITKRNVIFHQHLNIFSLKRFQGKTWLSTPSVYKELQQYSDMQRIMQKINNSGGARSGEIWVALFRLNKGGGQVNIGEQSPPCLLSRSQVFALKSGVVPLYKKFFGIQLFHFDDMYHLFNQLPWIE